MIHGLGRDYIPDPRDNQYLFRIDATDRWSKTWRLGDVTDQGSVPSCVGHAWYNWFRSSPISQRPISAEGIYKLAQHFDEWDGVDYAGTSIRGAARCLSITEHISEYRWSFDVEGTVNYVLNKGPVVAGTSWYQNMSSLSAGLMRASGRLVGGHAYLIYGASTRKEEFKIRNSWGKGWGNNGNARISFKDFEKLIKEDGEVCTAVEKRAD